GYLEDGIAGWTREGLPVEEVPQITVQQLDQFLKDDPDGIRIVDVRRLPEWQQGHIEGALHKPLDKLTTMLGDLDAARPIAVHCKSGYRSSISSSLLQRAGYQQVMNVIGGFDAWRACNLPYVADPPAVAAS